MVGDYEQRYRESCLNHPQPAADAPRRLDDVMGGLEIKEVIKSGGGVDQLATRFQRLCQADGVLTPLPFRQPSGSP